MGERFKRLQAAGFKHQTSAAYDRMRVPTLLTALRPDIMSTEYTCAANDDRAPAPGTPVSLQAVGDGVAVLQGNRRIGSIEGAECSALRDATGAGDGLLRAEVRSRSEIGGYFTVRLAEGK
jgi:hypothetical protein